MVKGESSNAIVNVVQVAKVYATVEIAQRLRARLGMNLTTSAGGGELEKLIVGVLFVGGQASGPYANALSVYLD